MQTIGAAGISFPLRAADFQFLPAALQARDTASYILTTDLKKKPKQSRDKFTYCFFSDGLKSILYFSPSKVFNLEQTPQSL